MNKSRPNWSTLKIGKSRKQRQTRAQRPVRQRQAKTAARQGRARSARSGPAPAVVRVAGSDTRQATLAQILTEDDAIVLSYLQMVGDPDAQPTRVPVVLGQFELETENYRAEYTATATAGANGLAYVIVGLDGWLESANALGVPAQQFASYSGGAQGTPIWTSTLAQNPAQTPAPGAASVGVPVDSVLLDGGLSADSRVRLTSAHLEVWSDAPAQTAQGDVVVAACRNSLSLLDAPLNSATFATVAALPQDYVVHKEFPLSGWKSGERVHAHVVPWTEECFVMDEMPAAGLLTAPNAGLAAIGVGMASGQTFRWRVVLTFEGTKPKTFRTGDTIDEPHYVDMARVTNSLRPMHSVGPTVGPIGHAKGKGPSAFAAAHPEKVAAMENAPPSFTDKLTGAAKGGLSWLAGKIPYVGGFAKSAVDWLFG